MFNAKISFKKVSNRGTESIFSILAIAACFYPDLSPNSFCVCDVGAPHKRERVFLVANADCFGHTGRRIKERSRKTEMQAVAVPVAISQRQEIESCLAEASICGKDFRLSQGVDRLRCLGNV